MAEVATKKSINVVSTKKNEVCGVQSNNGLIDLDNITTNNDHQLISLCDNNDDDDDLVLTNNTRNELDSEDKSLQELIESELALRICAGNESERQANEADDDQPGDAESNARLELDQEATEDHRSEERSSTARKDPVSAKRVLDGSRHSDELDATVEFLATESEHCSSTDDRSHGCRQNGYVGVETKDGLVEHGRVGRDLAGVKAESEVGVEAGRKVTTSDEPSDKIAIGGARVDPVENGEDLEIPRGGISKDACRDDESEEGHPRGVLGTIGGAEVVELGGSATILDENRREEEEEEEEKKKKQLLLGGLEADVSVGEVDATDDRDPNLLDSWLDVPLSAETRSQTAGQFSDNFDEDLGESIVVLDLGRTSKACNGSADVADGDLQTRMVNDHFGPVRNLDDPVEDLKAAGAFDDQDSNVANAKETISSSTILDEIESSDSNRKQNDHRHRHRQLDMEEPSSCSLETSMEEPSSCSLETSMEVVSTQEFIEMERRMIGEEVAVDRRNFRPNLDEPEISETSDTTSDDNSNNRSVLEKSKIHDAKTSDGETNLADSESEQNRNLDSWVTVEEATRQTLEEETQQEGEKLDEVKKSGTTTRTMTTTTNVVVSRCSDEDEDEAEDTVDEPTGPDHYESRNENALASYPALAPLATPDDETSDVSNTCDSESREETITTTSSSASVVTSTSSVKGGTKTKKKKIEGVAGNDASPNLTPRTKKTKKSKKSDLEKENISVNCDLEDPSMRTGSRQTQPEMIDFSDEDDLSNVNVKSLTQNYVSEASRNELERFNKERIATGVSIKQLCRSFGDISNMSDGEQTTLGKPNHTMEIEERASYCSLANLTNEGKEKDDRALGRPRFEKSSFNKFDTLSKKTVLHVRSVDAGKVQQQLNAVGQNGDANQNCRSCGKVVFQMEQTKAEGLVWHKNCFRCVQCGKQLNVDNYESHESTLYCKPHFKELFQPKPVEESDQPVRPRKPELIIRENEPKELPPDVVRASDKPDLGLEELSSLNVKSRFQVFEKAGTESANEIERSPSQIAVKRSPSILSKLAKFQAKGMDIGVADESLNGIPYEESSESEEEDATEEIEEVETEIIKAKRATRERPISFSKMDDIKNRWESTSQQGRREVQREARKEEIAGIRSRLFMGKQGKMKEMYQQAVAGSERVTKINAAEEIQHSTHARSIKERFERGEPIAASDDEVDSKPKPEKADEEVIAAGISRKSRSLFLELDASAAKTCRPVTPVNPKTPADAPRRARDMDSPEREIYRDPDVVRAEDRVDEVVHTDTARKMLSIFRQMEENACKEDLPDGPKPLKRFTPPPEDKFAKASASDSEEEEEEEGEESEGEESGEERDPNYVRASDKVEDEFLKQAQNAARAKTLRAKFEHWEETDGKASNHHVAEMEMAQGTGDQSSIESASSLRARFESLGSQTNEPPRTQKVKVNRFVEIQSGCMDVCESCDKKVYPLEKVETNNKIFHKQCFRCLQCNCILRMDTFTLNNGKLYCIPHFKQLFITRGNYDEGFGVDPHKNKWTSSNSNTATASPITVSNGDL